MSLEECQTKSFVMNLLLHATFKFCTTKRLWKRFLKLYNSNAVSCFVILEILFHAYFEYFSV